MYCISIRGPMYHISLPEVLPFLASLFVALLTAPKHLYVTLHKEQNVVFVEFRTELKAAGAAAAATAVRKN